VGFAGGAVRSSSSRISNVGLQGELPVLQEVRSLYRSRFGSSTELSLVAPRRPAAERPTVARAGQFWAYHDASSQGPISNVGIPCSWLSG